MSKLIRIAQWAQIHSLYLPLYVAMECDLFKKKGLDVELILAGNDNEIYQYVSSGKADFGVGDPVFCSFAENEKDGCRVVANLVERVGIWGITQNPVLEKITEVSDMVNLRIACFPKPSTTYSIIREIKERNRRLLSSMSIIEAPIGDQFEMLLNDKADIVLDIEPFISIAETKGYKSVFSFADFYGKLAFTGLYTNASQLSEDSAVVEVVVKSIKEALAIINKDPELIDFVSGKLFPDLDLSVIKSANRRLYSAEVWPKSARIGVNSWKRAVKIRRKIGQEFAEDVTAAICNDFI